MTGFWFHCLQAFANSIQISEKMPVFSSMVLPTRLCDDVVQLANNSAQNADEQ